MWDKIDENTRKELGFVIDTDGSIFNIFRIAHLKFHFRNRAILD
jgi:hypothetical protein